MDVNLELIKRIISSDELCDKVNSGDNKEYYISQIENYILALINDNENINMNIDIINRYLKKFIIDKNKEDIFFNKILLKIYGMNIKNSEFQKILSEFNFDEVKELLIKKYNEYILNRTAVPEETLKRMLSLYCYTCPNYIFPIEYINYFTYYLYSKDISLDYDLISYYYKQFATSFAKSKDVNAAFTISEDVITKDPYYDTIKNKITLFKQNIGETIDPFILSDIFYQITYLYIINCINNHNNKNYSFEQLELVKEICLMTILGSDYYEINYGDVSYSAYLKKQSENTVSNYFSKLGLKIVLKKSIIDSLALGNKLDDETDKVISVDILFDQTLKRENPNLLNGLIKNYPVLGGEYKHGKKKSLLNLLQDIYNNKKLLTNLNKDLNWHKSRLNNNEEKIIKPQIEKLNNKITICTSYINVMNAIILNGDLTSYDLLRSISDLITYDGNNKTIKNDIYLILKDVIPKKIKRLCENRDISYKENLKKKVIKCYLDSMSLVKKEMDTEYFMKIYSTLELCIFSFDID